MVYGPDLSRSDHVCPFQRECDSPHRPVTDRLGHTCITGSLIGSPKLFGFFIYFIFIADGAHAWTCCPYHLAPEKASQTPQAPNKRGEDQHRPCAHTVCLVSPSLRFVEPSMENKCSSRLKLICHRYGHFVWSSET